MACTYTYCIAVFERIQRTNAIFLSYHKRSNEDETCSLARAMLFNLGNYIIDYFVLKLNF